MTNHKDRSHALLAPSAAHRWLNCPPSAVAAELYPNQDTDFTREGTLAHEVAEVMVRTDRKGPGFPEGTTQEMLDCADDYYSYIQEQITSDDATVLLEQRVDLSDIIPDGFGSCDCVILQGSTMDVIDLKFGRGVKVDATANEQLMLYGWGALYDFGVLYDIETVRLHIFQPRLNHIDRWEITAKDLLEWGTEQVKPIAELAAKGQGDFLAGDWCRFCPHAGRCPKLTETCTEFVETHGMEVAVPVLKPDQVAEVLRLEPLVSLWLKRVKTQAMNDLLEGKEVPGWKVVEGKLGNRKWTDELAVLNFLASQGYTQEDVTETKLLSPAAMDKAIGKKKAAELLADYIERAPGAPAIAPESDKRPAYDRTADFENLEG